MERTALTVGGFTQPNVAKALIENTSSVEKGLTQRFLWLFPKPSYAKFETLEMIEEQFSDYLGNASIDPDTLTHNYSTINEGFNIHVV